MADIYVCPICDKTNPCDCDKGMLKLPDTIVFPEQSTIGDDLREAIAAIDSHVNDKTSLDLTFLRHVLGRALTLVTTIERMQKVLE